jgi:hypothetical protein
VIQSLELKKLWKPPPNRGYHPCVEPSQSYSGESYIYFDIFSSFLNDLNPVTGSLETTLQLSVFFTSPLFVGIKAHTVASKNFNLSLEFRVSSVDKYCARRWPLSSVVTRLCS